MNFIPSDALLLATVRLEKPYVMSVFMIENAPFTAKIQNRDSVDSHRQFSVESSSAQALSDLHQRALDASTRYRKAEAELLEVLDQIDQKRVYLHHQVSSVFAYCTEVLKLSESVSYNLITVMRKSRVVPELKSKSMSGAITLSNARRVAAVITPENKQDWLVRAETLSSRQLEKEIARVLPAAMVQERASYVSGSRVRLELGLSEEQMLRLRRVQDQVSQSRQRSVNLEETLGELMEFYLSKKCPVERARRVVVKRGLGAGGGKSGARSAGAEGASSERVNSRSVGLKRASWKDAGSERISAMSVEPNGESGDPVGDDSLASLPLPSGTRANSLARASEMKCDSRVLSKGSAQVLSSIKSPGFLEARAKARQERERVPAAVLHAVHLRDGRRCVHELSPGKVCGDARFIEIHHVIPVADGGRNTAENLVTLCVTHHRARHASA